MFALDLFNNDHERRLAEGAVDQLEQRRIDDLAMKMDDLVARAKEPAYKKNPAALAALMKEFQKCKAERDSYYNVKNETMGYGSLGEELSGDELNQRMAQLSKDAAAGITQSINKQSDDRIAALKNPPKSKSFMQQVGDKQIGMVKGAWKGLTSETGIPGNVPTEKIPGKEDLLKGKGRSYYEANQKKNSKEIDEGRLAVGDPVIVTASNEFEGKTGEIHELSPSGKFIIVDLYNHGKHSMHLSDVEYNQYADDENNDDWYDEGVAEGWYDPRSFPGAKIGPHIAGPVPTPVPQVKDQIIKLLITSHKDLIDKYGQRDVNIVAQSEAAKAEPTPQGIRKAVDNVINFLTSGLSVNRLRQQTLEDTVGEGWSDAMVARRTGRPRTPYSVYINGKKWKDFENDDHARAVMDKLKAKFKADGRDPETITIAPTDMSEGVEDYSGIYSPEAIALGKRFCDHYNITDDGDIQLAVEIIDSYLNEFKATSTPVDLKKIKSGVADAFRQVYRGMGPGPTFRKKFQEQGVAETALNPQDPQGDYEAKRKALHDLSLNKDVDQQAVLQRRLDLDREATSKKVAEAQTDYQKRRQRERDIDAGRPVKALPKNPQTDYARKRAQDKRDMELGEDQDTSGVERAILNRIMVAHTDLLMKFGPEKVMQAAEEVAYNVGDVDEIGTSDVSAYVHQVKQILGVPEEVNEKWSQKYKSSINCASPKGFSQKAHCAGKKK
jgi:hypothetical protein